MKTLLTVIPLVVVCCLLVGCQRGEDVAAVDVEADIQAIKNIVAEIEAANNTSDLEKYMSHLADDAARIPPNEPAAIGKEAVRSVAQQMFDEITLQQNIEVENVDVSGDLAVAHSTWSAVVTFRDDGEVSEVNGNMIMVFKKQSDGLWKRIYGIWSNESLISPDQAE